MSKPNRKRKIVDNVVEHPTTSRMNGNTAKSPKPVTSSKKAAEPVVYSPLSNVFPPVNVQNVPIVTNNAISKLHSVYKSIAEYTQKDMEIEKLDTEESEEDHIRKVTTTMEQGLLQINRMLNDYQQQELKYSQNLTNQK